MNDMAFPLAAAFENFIAVALLVISFISWIINMINSQNPKKGAAQAQRPPQRDKRIQDEIDMFLKGAAPGDEKRPAAAARRQEKDIEIVREPPKRRSPQPKRGVGPAAPRSPQTAQQQRTTNVQTQPQQERQTPRPKRMKRPERESQVLKHVTEHMRDRIDEQVALDLPHSIGQSVSDHLSGGTVAPLELPPGHASSRNDLRIKLTRQGILQAMHDPQTVRQAIMINEILAPPLARRADR